MRATKGAELLQANGGPLTFLIAQKESAGYNP